MRFYNIFADKLLSSSSTSHVNKRHIVSYEQQSFQSFTPMSYVHPRRKNSLPVGSWSDTTEQAVTVIIYISKLKLVSLRNHLTFFLTNLVRKLLGTRK